jgi:hypothetical protein
LEIFKKHLFEKKRGRSLEETTPGDVKDAFWGDKELKGITQHLWTIKVYAEYMSKHNFEDDGKRTYRRKIRIAV